MIANPEMLHKNDPILSRAVISGSEPNFQMTVQIFHCLLVVVFWVLLFSVIAVALYICCSVIFVFIFVCCFCSFLSTFCFVSDYFSLYSFHNLSCSVVLVFFSIYFSHLISILLFLIFSLFLFSLFFFLLY